MHIVIIFFLSIITAIKSDSHQATICLSIWSNLYDIYWPMTNGTTLSQPPCVNKAKEFLRRDCINGTWGPEPECYQVQFEEPPQCPEDFIYPDDLEICYTITEKSKFPPKCPFKDILPFNAYKSVIGNETPVWMPVTRSSARGFDVLRWSEASPLYQTPFGQGYTLHGELEGKNCLLFYNTTYIEEVSCEEEHPSVCAYNYFTKLSNQMCSSESFCYQSDFASDSACFCFGATTGLHYPKAELRKTYQNNIWANMSVAIALEKVPNGSYIWSNSQTEIGYTYWSTSVSFDSSHRYGVLTPEGWILTEQPYPFFLYEISVGETEPSLELSVHDNTLQLKATGYQGLKQIDGKALVFCFTDASSSELLYRYQSLAAKKSDSDSLVYEFEPLEDGPGHYWCEGFKLADMQVIGSNKILLRQKETYPFEFVISIIVPFGPGFDLIDKNIMLFLTKTFQDSFDSIPRLKNFYKTRLMYIEDVDQYNGKCIYATVHFTSSVSKNFTNNDVFAEYYELKAALDEYRERGNVSRIRLGEFCSVDFCPSEEMGEYHWPDTFSGETAFPEELCFQEDGVRVNKTCKGDFIGGAKWPKLIEHCDTLFPRSSITDTLLELEKAQDTETILEILISFSESPSDFNTIDVYLVARLFTHISVLDSTSLEIFAKIVDNLMEIDKALFEESQRRVRGTDIILTKLCEITANNPHPIEYSGKNFHLVISPVRDFTGIVVPKLGHSSSLPKLTRRHTEVKEIHELDPESAIWINPDKFPCINVDAPLIIMVFFKDCFFIEQNHRTFNTLFHIKILELETLENPVWVYQSVKNTPRNCLVWNYDEANHRGFWEQDSNSTNSEDYSLCQFWKEGYYGLNPEFDNDNVTESLIDVLNSNGSEPEMVSNLYNISKRYDSFIPVDISLVGKIMEKFSTSQNIDLRIFASIVDNLHRIQKETLRRSQMESAATDFILDHIDTVITHQNVASRVEILTDHFMIFVLEDFDALLLIEDNQTILPHVLEGDVQIDDVTHYKNLHSAVLLNPKLKNQIEADAKVVITVFSNDAFFSEKDPKTKPIGRIFGIILPIFEQYDGPVSIFYRAPGKNFRGGCAHWHYNRGISGHWFKKEIAHNEVNNLSRCDFWHTTHFGLLLMDDVKYKDDKILTWITTITCAISLVSLGGIIFTAVIFKKWRSNNGNQILLNIVFAMIFQTVFFYVSSTIDKKNSTLCTTIGVLLHYSTISEFFWMFVAAYLQFKRFVQVLEGPPQNILLKSCMIGWVLPMIPVTCVLLLDRDCYVNNNSNLCYPSGDSLHFGVWLPVSLVLLFNFALFVRIIYSVVCNKSDCGNAGNEATFQWRLGILLFFMLGLTWVFAFFAELHFGDVFVYLFCLTATLQGAVLFLFFIIFNINTKYLYKKSLKKCFNK